MDDNVVDHFIGIRHQAPGKADPTLRAAGAEARFRAGDLHRARFELHLFFVKRKLSGEDLLRLFPVFVLFLPGSTLKRFALRLLFQRLFDPGFMAFQERFEFLLRKTARYTGYDRKVARDFNRCGAPVAADHRNLVFFLLFIRHSGKSSSESAACAI